MPPRGMGVAGWGARARCAACEASEAEGGSCEGGGGNSRQRVASEACKCEALPPKGSKLRLLIATGNAPLAQLRSNLLLLFFLVCRLCHLL